MPQFGREAKFGWKGALDLDAKKSQEFFFDLATIGNNVTRNTKTYTCAINNNI
jgi:hypothetical protein